MFSGITSINFLNKFPFTKNNNENKTHLNIITPLSIIDFTEVALPQFPDELYFWPRYLPFVP